MNRPFFDLQFRALIRAGIIASRGFTDGHCASQVNRAGAYLLRAKLAMGDLIRAEKLVHLGWNNICQSLLPSRLSSCC